MKERRFLARQLLQHVLIPLFLEVLNGLLLYAELQIIINNPNCLTGII